MLLLFCFYNVGNALFLLKTNFADTESTSLREKEECLHLKKDLLRFLILLFSIFKMGSLQISAAIFLVSTPSPRPPKKE